MMEIQKKGRYNTAILTMLTLFFLSLTIFILSRIYDDQIPKIIEEINNGAIGAILTAIITALILGLQSSINEKHQHTQNKEQASFQQKLMEEQAEFQKNLMQAQSETDEIKEYNLKVFEEKTKRYNKFINELWNAWDDREITMEELKTLLSLVSKDILLFTKRETSTVILERLNRLAELSMNKEILADEKRKEMQCCVFDIINALAKEMNLGGEINIGDRNIINLLESKIEYHTERERYKALFLEKFTEKFSEFNCKLFEKPKYETINNSEFISVFILKAEVALIVGPVVNEKNPILGFYVEPYGAAKEYNQYRLGQKSWKRRYLNDVTWLAPSGFKLIDFDNPETLKELITEFKENEEDNQAYRLAVLAYSFF